MKNRYSLKYHHVTVFIFLLALGVYWNALSNGFVYDDKFAVVENHWIRDGSHIPDILFHDSWGFSPDRSSSYYRPLMFLIYMITYHFLGAAPWGFHLVNILFHAGASVLVFVIARRLLGTASGSSPSAPFLAAVLFATHPVHTEAVAWVAGLPEVSYAFFYLLAFHLYLLSTETGRVSIGYYLSSVFFFFLSVLSKEPALTLR